MACCYWEYARESAFIRDVRQRCLEDQLPEGKRDKSLHMDLQKVQSIGYAANFFLRGFFCPPDGVLSDALRLRPGEVHRLTGAFPKPWQLLTKEERQYRAHKPARGVVDFVKILPFERGRCLDAQDIVKTVIAQRRLRDQDNTIARMEYPKFSEQVLSEKGMLNLADVRPSIMYASGMEMTVVQINWGIFTNEDIIQAFRSWVKANRPEDMPAPDNKGRNKARDWRVALERLAIMRLLHRLRLGALPTAYPQAWRQYGRRDWYKERKRAGRMFGRLFPFLSKLERPLGWQTKGGHSR